jgi:hypothetical protein
MEEGKKGSGSLEERIVTNRQESVSSLHVVEVE